MLYSVKNRQSPEWRNDYLFYNIQILFYKSCKNITNTHILLYASLGCIQIGNRKHDTKDMTWQRTIPNFIQCEYWNSIFSYVAYMSAHRQKCAVIDTVNNAKVYRIYRYKNLYLSFSVFIFCFSWKRTVKKKTSL